MLKQFENDDHTPLNPIKIVYEHPSERVELDTNADNIEKNKLIEEQDNNSELDNISDKVDILNLDFKYNINYSPVHCNMNNNLVLRNMFLMSEDTRHFLAPPLAITTDSEYFQRKLTPTSATLSMNSNATMNTTVNSNTTNNTNTANNSNSSNSNNSNSNNSSNNNTISTTANHIIQNTTTQNINSISNKVTLSQINHAPKARPHTCEECGKAFMLKHHLLTHMRVHTGERPHICPECGKTFALKHCLSTHLLLHTAERPYKCMECSKTFTLKHHLVSHERVHTRERPFECPECGRRFPQKRHLTTHIKFHSGERPYSCQICGENFSREEHLVMHSRFHGGQSPYVCPDCGAGFLRKFELVNHERQHGRNPESCSTCGKEFLQKRTLLMHARTCGIRSTNKPTIQSTQTFDLNKTCRECGESFATSEGLALHYRLHIGDHSFLTDICSLAATLKQSVPAVNAISNTVVVSKKIHECSDCGRSFTQKHGLYQHRARHPNASCKLKPYTCEKCGKSFSQKNHLSLHERQHMNPPPSQLRRLQMQERQQQQPQTSQSQQQLQQQTQQQSQPQIQSQQLQTQQQPSTQTQHQTTMNHIGTLTVYNVTDIKSETAAEILSQQTTAQTVTNDTQPELLRHLHLNNPELQSTRIMQHMQQQTQTTTQIVNNMHKIEQFQ